MPRVDEIIDTIAPAKFITTLDLAKGYYQVPLADSSSCKTAFVTPQGKFEFTALPFGLKNAPAGFQRLMDSVLAGEKSALAYIDDVVVHSQTWDQHLEDLERHSDDSREQALRLRKGSAVSQRQLSHSWVMWWAEVKLDHRMQRSLPSKPTSCQRRRKISGPF